MNEPVVPDGLNKGQGIYLDAIVSAGVYKSRALLCYVTQSVSHPACQVFSELTRRREQKLSLVDLFSLYLDEGMPCLHSEALESMESGRAAPGASRAERTQEFFRVETVSEPEMVKGTRWFFSPLWSPRTKTRGKRLDKSDKVEAWLDDHSDFTRAYFLRRASA